MFLLISTLQLACITISVNMNNLVYWVTFLIHWGFGILLWGWKIEHLQHYFFLKNWNLTQLCIFTARNRVRECIVFRHVCLSFCLFTGGFPHVTSHGLVQTCSLRDIPYHPCEDPPDLFQLVQHVCSPYIYRQAGGWPLIERLSCLYFFWLLQKRNTCFNVFGIVTIECRISLLSGYDVNRMF